MADKLSYQKNVASFAIRLEGALAKADSPKFPCILKAHVQLLRTITSIISTAIGGNPFPPHLIVEVFNLDVELHHIYSIISELGIEDRIQSEKERQNVHQLKALRDMKSLINLFQLRVKICDSIFICVASLSKLDVTSRPVPLPPSSNAGDIQHQTKVIADFFQACMQTPAFAQNNTLRLDMNLSSAYQTDLANLPMVLANIKSGPKFDHIQANVANRSVPLALALESLVSNPVGGDLLQRGYTELNNCLPQLDQEILMHQYFDGASSGVVVNFKKGRRLGDGYLGAVVVGKIHKQENAFKMIKVDQFVKLAAESRNEILNELRLKGMHLSHENILTVNGVTLMQQSEIYLSFKLLKMSLSTFLHSNNPRQLEVAQISNISLGILQGLEFLHRNSVIHNSLHPGNILLTEKLGVKLTDFGTAHLKRDEVLNINKMMAGVNKYLAPEVLKDPSNPDLTFATDMYSFGLICWELGENNNTPYSDPSIVDVRSLKLAVVDRKQRPNVLGDSSLPPWLREYLKQCWAEEPWARPSAAEAQNVFQQNIIVQEDATDFRGRPTVRQPILGKLSIGNTGRVSSGRKSGSRLSGVRTSVQRAHVRPSSQARTSVILQEQRFRFLEDIKPSTQADVAIKIVKAMRFYTGDAELQVRGLVGLRIILQGRNRERAVGRMGSGQAAIIAIHHHLKEVAVVEPACGLIGNLCVDYKVSEALMRSGAAVAVVKGLHEHMSDVAVAEEALIAITNLHSGDHPRQRFFIELNVSDLIIKVCKVHRQNPSVLKEAYAAMTYLHSGWYGDELPCKSAKNVVKKSHRQNKLLAKDFFDLGCHDLIIDGMKGFKEDSAVQIEAFTAIATMITGYTDRKKKIIKTKVVIPHLVQTLKRHGDEPQLCEAAFLLVFQLAEDKSSHKEFLALQVHAEILDALQKFTEVDDESLQLYGIRALYSLCYKDQKASRYVRDNNGVEAVVRAEALYPDNQEIVTAVKSAATVIARGGKS